MFERNIGWIFLGKFVYRLRSPYSGYDIFSLRINKIFPVKTVFPRGRISCKSNSGGRSFPHISVNHGYYVYRCPPVFWNLI